MTRGTLATQIGGIAAAMILIAGCAGTTYLPGQPGGPNSDLSGQDVREAWVAANPDRSPEIREAILEGVFVEGMTVEERDVISNPRREGVTGNGYWRSRKTGGETRYTWYVSNERTPFKDGRGRLVCELVYVEGSLQRIRYCGGGS